MPALSSRWSAIFVASISLAGMCFLPASAADAPKPAPAKETKPDPKPADPKAADPKAADPKPKPKDEPKLPTPSPSSPEWKLEVLKEKPNIHVPSVVCTTPDGRILVAEDPMDQFGPGNQPGDRILCLWPDGHTTVFADKLYAVFGIAYLDGKVHVHHSPKYTVFTDDPATGVGKNPVVIYDTDNPATWGGGSLNDHIPSQIRLGMDGWMYMSTGDKGIYGLVSNIDKSAVELRGGGIIRFRPDGTHFENYVSGTRNHLDMSMNAEDEIFTYDNTDDGLGWWTRFTHLVDGGYYGYPYDYRASENDAEGMAHWKALKEEVTKARAEYDKKMKEAKTDEEKAKIAKPSQLIAPFKPYTLWAMEDYGGGSPCGATPYNEDALPPEYRGNLFHSEWGKQALERFIVERIGATYRVVKRDDKFLKGGTQSFRPLGVCVSNDGMSFYICDWNYNGWNNKTDAGRLLKLTYTGKSLAQPKPTWFIPAAMGQTFDATTADLIAALKHPAQSVRLVASRRIGERGAEAVAPLVALMKDKSAPDFARWSAIWTLDRTDEGKPARPAIIALVTDSSQEVSVRMQAARELGTRRAKEAGPALIAALDDSDAAMRLRASTALGRIGDPSAVSALVSKLTESDLFARFASFTALNRIAKAAPAAWDSIIKALSSQEKRIVQGATFAMRDAYDPGLVSGLANYAADSANPASGRAAAITALAPLTRQPKPWNGKWWATQPQRGGPPAHDVDWTGTITAQAALKKSLEDTDPSIRSAAIAAQQVAPDPAAADLLVKIYESDKDIQTRKAVLRALAAAKSPSAATLAASILNNAADKNNADLVLDAMSLAVSIGTPQMIDALGAMLAAKLPAETLIAVTDALSKTKDAKAVAALQKAIANKDPQVASAAATTLGNIPGDPSLKVLTDTLKDPRLQVRKAAAAGLGLLKNRKAVDALLVAYKDAEMSKEALSALSTTPDMKALDALLDGLASPDGTVRGNCRKAIQSLGRKALTVIEARLDTNPLPTQAITELQGAYQKLIPEKERDTKLWKFDTKALSPQAFETFAKAHPGNAKEGKKVFNNPNMACVKCHKVGTEGGDIGPSLTGVGTKYDRQFLIESVLYPSKQILDGYQQTIIRMKDGDAQSGVLKVETDTEVTLFDAAAQKIVIKKMDIKEREHSKLSLMPEGLHTSLKPEEFSDLVAYLESLKEAPKK